MVTAADKIDREVKRQARALYMRAAEHKPSIFEGRDLLGRMIDWSLEDDSLRTALFRFVDVLPSLQSSAEIGRHLEEYFARVDHALGGLVYVAQALQAGRWVAPVVRRNVVSFARRFIAEENTDQLISIVSGVRAEPAAFTLDVVGEATVSDSEAVAMENRYLTLLRSLSGPAAAWPLRPQIDESPFGPVPRVNLSVKLSSLCARFDPLDPETESAVRRRVRSILREAGRLGAAVTIDMEQYAFKPLTFQILRALLEEEEFRSTPPVGLAVQAYLRDTESDLADLIGWAKQRVRRIGIRLVKGAYWDSEVAWAQQKNWPVPVFLDKAETDGNFERLSRLLLANNDIVDAAFGSHNLRSLAYAIVTANRLGVPRNGYEIQMLYGMAEPFRRAIIENGQRVRVYLPVGELLPGMSYLIRRLMENTSNTSFLRQTYADKKDVESLIAAPTAAARNASRLPQAAHPGEISPFRNEPAIDFAHSENRAQFYKALEATGERIKRRAMPARSGEWLESVNPANLKEVVGRVRIASTGEADDAIAAATRFFPKWRATPAKKRADILLRAAEIMRRKRWELASWEVFEVGKGWREADGDIIEAIDYLEYYAREMIRLAQPRITQQLAGESNVYFYEPRGIAAIIAPWNFPLAILTG
ncbi:MAG TPA: proline dehydrogenase family protein, partial [Candidatus Binatia bacterium]